MALTMNPRIRSIILDNAKHDVNEAQKWMRRISCELSFAGSLAKAFPNQTESWNSLIAQAKQCVEQLPATAGLVEFQQAVTQAEAILSPIGAEAKTFSIYCVGHGHIDMNWMWSWPETVSTTHDTFAAMLAIMRDYPGFTFSQSQASVYALMERYYPALFDEIRQKVKDGQWEVTAAHWVEGDKNLASGESIARHLLLTRKYFKEKFGLEPEDVPVDWEPDTFGHAATLPSILADAGVKYYYSCRPGGGFDHARIGDARPRLFWWEAPNGARVLVNRESTWYNSYVNIDDNVAMPMVAFYEETGLRDWLNIYGVGNHGGGPTRTEIEFLMEANAWPIYPNIIFSTTKAWYEKTEKNVGTQGIQLPVLNHELNFEFTGCYTSQSAIKRANRLGEAYCVDGETALVLTDVLGSKTLPKQFIDEAWIKVLFGQFHDILPGSGVVDTREHALAEFQEVGATCGSAMRTLFDHLASNVDTSALIPGDTLGGTEQAGINVPGNRHPFESGAGIGSGETGFAPTSGGGKRHFPFIVYNSCTWVRTDYVIVDLYDTKLDPHRIVAIDEDGEMRPTMFMGRAHDWGHDKLTLLVEARNVPGLGYKTILLCEGEAVSGLTVQALPQYTFATPHFQIQYDRFTNGLKSVQFQGQELTDGRFGFWQCINERPRGMTAWVIGEPDRGPVPMLVNDYDVLGGSMNWGTGLRSSSDLAYCAKVKMHLEGTSSTLQQRMIVHPFHPRIDFETTLDWREIGDNMRGIPGMEIIFDHLLEGAEEAKFEAPYGVVERGYIPDDVPSRNFVHLSGNGMGMTFLQDCKYGHRHEPGRYTMRVVRSSFDPDHAPEVRKTKLRYAVYLHNRTVGNDELIRLGEEWLRPLIAFPATLQSNGEPAVRSFVKCDTPGVVLSSVKPSEDCDGVVLRLVETNGSSVQAQIELDAIWASRFSSVKCVDLLERPVTGEARLEGNRVVVDVPSKSLVSVSLIRH